MWLKRVYQNKNSLVIVKIIIIYKVNKKTKPEN
jgi:hypothetical protein